MARKSCPLVRHESRFWVFKSELGYRESGTRIGCHATLAGAKALLPEKGRGWIIDVMTGEKYVYTRGRKGDGESV